MFNRIGICPLHNADINFIQYYRVTSVRGFVLSGSIEDTICQYLDSCHRVDKADLHSISPEFTWILSKSIPRYTMMPVKFWAFQVFVQVFVQVFLQLAIRLHVHRQLE